MPKTAKNSKRGFKWLLPSTGYFIQWHSKVCRQSGVRYTYQLHMILRTRGVFRSAACRQPASSSIRSGRCPRWSHTRARSHCYTDGNRQRAAALVTQAGWHSIHFCARPLPSSNKTPGKQQRGRRWPSFLPFQILGRGRRGFKKDKS